MVLAKLKLEWKNDEFVMVGMRMFTVADKADGERLCVRDGRHVEWDFATGKLNQAVEHLVSMSDAVAVKDLIDDIEQNELLGAEFIRLRTVDCYVEVWMIA